MMPQDSANEQIKAASDNHKSDGSVMFRDLPGTPRFAPMAKRVV